MNLVENLKQYKYPFILIFSLVLSKSIVQLFEFPNSIKLSLIRILLFILAIGLTFFLLKNWKIKLFTTILICSVSILQGEFNVWKIPAKKEVKMIQSDHFKIFTILKNHPNDLSLGQKRMGDLAIKNPKNKELISNLFNQSKIVEIEKTNTEILFVYDRFIDNGYGLLYSPKSEFEEEFWNEPFRINGLEITSISKISENWYYVSFT